MYIVLRLSILYAPTSFAHFPFFPPTECLPPPAPWKCDGSYSLRCVEFVQGHKGTAENLFRYNRQFNSVRMIITVVYNKCEKINLHTENYVGIELDAKNYEAIHLDV